MTTTTAKADGMTVTTLKEFGLHLEIVVDDASKAWFVRDLISDVKTGIEQMESGWTNEDLVTHVKLTLGIVRATKR